MSLWTENSMAIHPNTDRGTTGRWKYGWVPPTPAELCDMLKSVPDNGTTVAQGTTKVIGFNSPDCPEWMNVERDIYVTDMVGTNWDDATNTVTWVLNLSNGSQVSIPIAITDLMGIWFVNQSRTGDFGDTIIINNLTAETFTSPDGSILITTDDATKETRFVAAASSFRTVVDLTTGANTIVHNLNKAVGTIQMFHLPTQMPIAFEKISEGLTSFDVYVNSDWSNVEVTYIT